LHRMRCPLSVITRREPAPDPTMGWSCSLDWRGRGAEGERLMRPVYETALRMYGPDDVQTLGAGNELAWTLMQQPARGCDEAEALEAIIAHVRETPAPISRPSRARGRAGGPVA